MKLVTPEAESSALLTRVVEAPLVSSELALTELPRAIARLSIGRGPAERQGLLAETQKALGGLALVPMDRDLLCAAAALAPAWMRALDAIHVAAALLVADDIDAFVTYDARQQEGAAAAGLAVLAPGS